MEGDEVLPPVVAQEVEVQVDSALDLRVPQEPVRGSQPGDFQGLQFMVADMEVAVRAARTLTRAAADEIDSGSPAMGVAGAAAKLFASDTAMRVTTDAVQLLGGSGYVRDHPVERMMRDAKITQIYEGTNQIQRIVIARSLLG